MFDKIKNFANARRSTANDLKDDQQNVPLLTTMVNEKAKQTAMESSIKDIYKDLDNIKITDETINSKLENLIDLNESKVLWFIKNSKAGADTLSILHFAAKHFRYSACQVLVDGVLMDINKESKSLKTPLHTLVKSDTIKNPAYLKKFVKCFELFIERKANYNAQDETGMSILHCAVHNENLKAVELLCEQDNIDISPVDAKGLTPLHYACMEGLDDIALILIEKSDTEKLCDSTGAQNLPIHLAVAQKTEKARVVLEILDKVKLYKLAYLENLMLFKLNDHKKSILEIAIENNHLMIIEEIIKEFYENYDLPDANGNLPIHLAADNGSTQIFDILEKYKAVRYAPNSKNDNPLHLAALKNRFSFIEHFLKSERNYITDLDDGGVDIVPCIKQYNNSGHTPLFSALIMDSLKCVEVLSANDDCDNDAEDPEGNSIFHICAQYNNVESTRYILKNPVFIDSLFIKNKSKETPLHVAGKNGNVDIIKMILGKFYDGTLDAKETYLMSKDYDGRSCFHLICIGGYFNIVEYLIKDMKLTFLIELVDDYGNSPLHYVAMYGHLSIAEILLMYEPDLSDRNNDGSTPLELSCRKGFFDISKLIINSIKEVDLSFDSNSLNPLHMAAQEGAHEVVALLLEKGYPIDLLNEENKNILDIALENEHKDVITVLLENPNWEKLIDYKSKKAKVKKGILNFKFKKILGNAKPKEYTGENPQLYSLFEKKMWDSYMQILDNSYSEEENSYNFKVLDPPCKILKRHPLMLLARSGQETILKHETTQKLLDLKWRIIPRFAFYSNLFFYLVFLTVFGLYSIELTDMTFADASYRNSIPNANEDIDEIWDIYTSIYHWPIFSMIIFSFIKIFFQVLLLDGMSYMMSADNWIELLSIIFAAVAIFANTLAMKTQYSSIAVLTLFTSFTFLIQKLKVFGVYVLAFRRTLVNSAKFFPVFLIIYIGFLLSFRVRVNADVNVFNSTGSTSFLQGITMMMGDFQTSQMGVEKSMLNYFLYVTFICVMSIIILNLFVGIAVGEISQTLEEADIQQISMRIVFTLKVQEALAFTEKCHCLNKLLNMRFGEYSFEKNESKFSKSVYKFIEVVTNKLKGSSPEINLVDPQTRLEESIAELSENTDRDFKAIKDTLYNQMIDVNDKLNNSKIRLEDCLTEMSRKTVSNFENSADDSSAALLGVETNLTYNQSVIKSQINSLNSLTLTKFHATKQSFIQKLVNSDNLNIKNHEDIVDKLNKMLELDLTNIAGSTKQIQSDSVIEFKLVKTMLAEIDNKMVVFQRDLDKLYEKLHTTQNQVIQSDYKLNTIEMMSRKEKFSMKLDDAHQKLDSMRGQEDTFVPEIDRIKLIENSVGVLDEKLNKSLTESLKLDVTIAKLDSLAKKTLELEPEIDRIKLVESNIEIADSKLNKCLEESKKLDDTLERLENLNAKMTAIQPDLSKIEAIELCLEKFESKQDNLIEMLVGAINRKKEAAKDKPIQTLKQVTTAKTSATTPAATSATEAATTSKSISGNDGTKDDLAKF